MRELIVFVTIACLTFVCLWKLIPPVEYDEEDEEVSDLTRKMRWVTKHYAIETDPFQTLLTSCYRVRLYKINNEVVNIFIDLCDDFFAGFRTLTYTKDGAFVGENFNEYSPEPTIASECPSGLPEGETIWDDPESDQFEQLR